MHNLISNAIWLGGSETDGYLARTIPDPLDERISRLVAQWAELPEEERLADCARITEDQQAALSVYSERMAALAVRTMDPTNVVRGLIALGIDDWRGEWREQVMVVALHYDASCRIGVSPVDVFKRAATVLPPRSSKGVLDFATKRAPENRTLEAMEYVATQDADGFRYRRSF